MALGPLLAAVLLSTAFDRNAADALLLQRIAANRQAFFVYRDSDSAFNHGFPSGFFGALDKIDLDASCIDDAASANGCTTDRSRLDRVRGNVLRISFNPLSSGQYAGVNFEEPENWGVQRKGSGYDLRGATAVTFDVRSPSPAGIKVQFGVGESTATAVYLPHSETFSTMTILLQSLAPPLPSLQNVHILFTVVANDINTPNGGTLLLDNIRFTPVPAAHTLAIGFPLANETFGVVPSGTILPGRVPIPIDQVIRNLSPIYESALTIDALLDRGTPDDLTAAGVVADAFDYALRHEIQGLPLPTSTGGAGLHSAYEGGDLSLFNDQTDGTARAGDVRLAGFSASSLCDPSHFCLVLDGATGGNVAFAILALVRAWESLHKTIYLDDARIIGRWAADKLPDATGFGGYYLGYPDEDKAKILIKGKSIENNADLFAAFSRLAEAERSQHNDAAAAEWTARANVAGDFVMQLFEPLSGRFYAGTVPVGTERAPGVTPDGPQRGNDVINTSDFADSNTFTVLALASAARYRTQIDWRRPVEWLAQQAVTVQSGGRSWSGFSIVATPTAGPPGIAWEFTGQTIVAMRFVDCLYGDSHFATAADLYLEQLTLAQSAAPFGDGAGVVASTIEDGDHLPPTEHCLSTPFQCIPERVGLAATTWGVFAARGRNPLSPSAILDVCPPRRRAVNHNVH